MFGLKSAVYVHTVHDIPKVEHWVILDNQSYIESPGHGYPSSTERYVGYLAYTNKADFEADVKDRVAKNRFAEVRVVHVEPLTIKATLTLEVSPP